MFGGLNRIYNHKTRMGAGGVQRVARAYHKGYFRRYKFRGYGRYRAANRRRQGNRVITQVHRLEQYNGGTGVHAIGIVSGNTDSTGQITNGISEFPGTGPFKALYHQFRVVKCTAIFEPVNMQGAFNTEDAVSTALTDYYTPTLYTAINRSGNGFALNITEMMSTAACKWTTANKRLVRTRRPCTLDQVFKSVVPGASTAYSPERS